MRRSSRPRATIYEMYTPLTPIHIARVERPPTQPDDTLPDSEDPVMVYYAGEEDPGPCRVALAYLYMLEDRRAGTPRIRNPALHVKIISLGLRQLSELRRVDRFDVAYIISLSRDNVVNLLKLLGVEASDVEKIACNKQDLEYVTSVRAMRLRL
ncbi:hypothetical protein [Aeropyrum pernix]|nr:hypothetical protein [Aeropyrum pernix]